jgi:hypothetical protein
VGDFNTSNLIRDTKIDLSYFSNSGAIRQEQTNTKINPQEDNEMQILDVKTFEMHELES